MNTYYNLNGNRQTETNTLRGINRTYTVSDEDHIITAGTDTYQFNVDGFLTQKTTSQGTMTTSYSTRGESLSATLPNETVVAYDHDPLGRRIAKRVNGTITEKYLWQNNTKLLAVYDGSDTLIMRFTYADDRVPVSMTYNGLTYYLTYDQIGSLRAVVDTSGNIVKRIGYDTYGSIINDTNPSLSVPFGFAGGLHDRDTGLVRFGARDYDPTLGRWTAKDLIDFAGGDTNLYGYVANDPVNGVDPEGLAVVNTKGSPYDFWKNAGGAASDFYRNYRDMRDANTIGADKYFHCKANCEASQCGFGGAEAAEAISETREFLDEHVKGDSRSACDADRAANQQGRNTGSNTPCSKACESLRPAGLDPRY